MKRGMTCRLAVAGLVFFAGVGSATAADWRPDEWITTKTSIALFNIPEVDPSGVSVSSKDGHVTLVGAVPTANAKAKVVDVVKQVEGVKDIRDDLQVSDAPAPAPRRIPGSDELRGEVVKKISDDPDLRDNSISVRAEQGGVVELGGFANSLSDQLRALRIARGTTGVMMVRNEMKSPPDTLYDPLPAGGSAQGEDSRNRRERQALEGQAVEPIPVPAGDAPAPKASDEHPAAINPEGDTTHSPHAEE